MIYGIGVDMVRVERVEQALQRFGERFARRLLGTGEMEWFHRAPHPAHFLAKRFAAKEAAAKALGTGFRDGLALSDIRVVSDPLGKPMLEFAGEAARLCEEREIGAAHLSLSDEREYAVAFVTLERRN